MPSLGKAVVYNIHSPGEEEPGKIEINPPNEVQYMRFQARLQAIYRAQVSREKELEEGANGFDPIDAMAKGDDLAIAITELCVTAAKELVTKVTGFDPKKGMTQKDALFLYGTDTLASIGQNQFMQAGGAKVVLDVGKSEKRSVDTTQESSAS